MMKVLLVRVESGGEEKDKAKGSPSPPKKPSTPIFLCLFPSSLKPSLLQSDLKAFQIIRNTSMFLNLLKDV